VDCNTVCASGSGTWSASMGMCQCLGLTPVDDICDAACRAAATQVSIGDVFSIFALLP
jgi:hypothetical protein